MALGKTAQFYRDNPNSYKKKLAKANKHPVWGEQTSKRKEKKRQDRKARRKAKKEGLNVEGKHWDIKTKTWMSEKQSLVKEVVREISVTLGSQLKKY